MSIPHPRPDYFYIFYSELADRYWVVPSQDIVALAMRTKRGQYRGTYTVEFCRGDSPDASLPHLAKYENNFDLLSWT